MAHRPHALSIIPIVLFFFVAAHCTLCASALPDSTGPDGRLRAEFEFVQDGKVVPPIDGVLELRKAPFQIRYTGKEGVPSVFASWNPATAAQWRDLRGPLATCNGTHLAVYPSSLYVDAKPLTVFEGWNPAFERQWGRSFNPDDLEAYKIYRRSLNTEPLLVTSGRNYTNFQVQSDGSRLYPVDLLDASPVASYPPDAIYLVLFADKDFAAARARLMQFYPIRWAPLTIRFAASSRRADDSPGYVFEWSYSPNKKYVRSINNSKSTTLAMERKTQPGDERSRQMLRPVAITSDRVTKSVITTGSPDAQENIPFTVKIIENRTTLGLDATKAAPGLQGKIESYTGVIVPNTKRMRVLSIGGKDLSQKENNFWTMAVNREQDSLRLPAYPMKIGDAYTHRHAAAVTIPFKTIEVNVFSTYTLRKIEGALALFDIASECALSPQHMQDGMSAAGSGTGSLRFDLQKQMPLNYLSSVEIKVEVDGPEAMTSVVDRSTVRIEHTME